MSLHTYFPQAPLSNFVNMIWIFEGTHSFAQQRVLPDGAMELAVNLSDDPLCLFSGADCAQPQTFDGGLVIGSRSEFFVVDSTRPFAMLSVHFKPGGALAFFGAPASALHNLHLPLETLWRAKAKELRGRLLEARTPQAKFRIVEQVLCAQLQRAPERHRAVAFALTAFNNLPHTQTVSQVIEQIGLSPRRFIQVFTEEVGLTPKLFCRVRRFQSALRLFGQPGSWTDIALACGYFDQAHLINDFRDFAGLSPTQYLPVSSEHRNNVPLDAAFDEGKIFPIQAALPYLK